MPRLKVAISGVKKRPVLVFCFIKANQTKVNADNHILTKCAQSILQASQSRERKKFTKESE